MRLKHNGKKSYESMLNDLLTELKVLTGKVKKEKKEYMERRFFQLKRIDQIKKDILYLGKVIRENNSK